MARGAYATPLGTMSIHEEICNRLIEVNDIIHHTLAGHVSEQVIEVQLPFIQFALGYLPIVPLIMADRTWSLCSTLAHILATTIIDFRILLIASSDLYHGYSYKQCCQSDAVTLHEAKYHSPEAFYNAINSGKAQACGAGPITVAKEYSQLIGSSNAVVLSYTTSADITKDCTDYVVGYAALAYFFSNN